MDNVCNKTKGEVLKFLKNKLERSYVEDLIVFTIEAWDSNKKDLLSEIKSKFNDKSLVVRSSSILEDSKEESKAGYFYSELGVKNEDFSVTCAVEKVIASYSSKGVPDKLNQILIQSQTSDVEVSGVMFTRQIETNAPYYVINYDKKSGKTNTVTGGMESSVISVSHFADINKLGKWSKLIAAAKEIEKIIPDTILDIEFAIKTNNDVVIFQVRPLAANKDVEIPDDVFIKHLKVDMANKFMRYSRPEPHLAAGRTIFSDMSDWNPSEIIGSRPNTLDYSIYSFIVTDEIWHQARTALGYYDVFPSELMISFGKKPYIDTRASFNSMTPACISSDIRNKLVGYYLDTLEKNPSSHDKVEFDILFTCFDFSLLKKLKKLKEHSFTKEEIALLSNSLHELTNNILKNADTINKTDMDMIAFLSNRREMIMQFYNKQERVPWNTLNTAYNILQNCKKYGTLPFSKQARLAFIAKSIMLSLKEQGVISDGFYNDFFSSIRTIASDFNDDSYLYYNGKMDLEEFLDKYGHLRAGTYDITSRRYDQMDRLFKHKENNKKIVPRKVIFSPDKQMLDKIDDIMKQYNIYGNAESLLDFVRISTENREYAKFEFTKCLSDSLELIAEAGELLGFSRNEICHADWPTLIKFRNPEKADEDYAVRSIQASIERHKSERKWYDNVILPPIIKSSEDFYCVKSYDAVPNFITTGCVEGPVFKYDRIKDIENVDFSKYIVLFENADPGYDWIFSKSPLGIVTKYGGVASHIAIRCAEFGIPAAIGCGEVMYDKVKKSNYLIMNCEKKILRTMQNSFEEENEI